MFRHRGRHLRRREIYSEEALALLARDDDNGVESGSESDVEDKPEAPKVPPGRPTRLPLPPGLRPGPVDAILPTGEPVPEAPETSPSEVSSATSTSETISTSSSPPPTPPPPPPPPPPGIIPIENPGTPIPPSTTSGSSSTTSTATSTTTTAPKTITGAPNLPISFPTTFRTSSTPASSYSISIVPLPSPTTSTIPAASESPTPGPADDPTAAAQLDPPKATLKPGAKAGIAMGTLAAVAMLASLLFFLWRRHHLRKARDSLIFSTPRATHMSQSQRAPPPSGPTAAGTGTGVASTTPSDHTDAQILNDLLATAYAHQNGRPPPPSSGNSSSGLSDEKRNQVVTILDRVSSPADSRSLTHAYPYPQVPPHPHAQSPTQAPSPSHQPTSDQHPGGGIPASLPPNAEIRSSIASWLRRHHPLQLNPMAGRADSREGSLRSPSTPGSPRSLASAASSASFGAGAMPKSPSPLGGGVSAGRGGGGASQQQENGNGKFLSVWSETSRATSGMVSEETSSVPSYYGQALGSPSEEREGGDVPDNRASSPVLGAK